MVLILGIESTCDETACAVVRNGVGILSNIVASQAEMHEVFGGVVPELACRYHVEAMIPTIDLALKEAGLTLQEIDAIAVARGPGLVGAILIGLNTAKALAMALNKPLIGVNHVEAHLYATLMTEPKAASFPALGVVLSGGHTALLEIAAIGKYRMVGATVDDAIGEAFDKVAAILGLPYPGGPSVEKLAKLGSLERFFLQAGLVKKKPLAFSFSGLKTKVLYAAKGQNSKKNSPLVIKESEKADLAAAFQEVALGDVLAKVKLACVEGDYRGIIFGGGVCHNQRLREMFQAEFGLAKVSADALPSVYFPSIALSLDNAAMIAGLAYQQYLANPEGDSLDLEPATRIPLG